MHGETCKYEGMRRAYWHAAMTEDAAQRSRWTFYEVVLTCKKYIKRPGSTAFFAEKHLVSFYSGVVVNYRF